MSILSTFVHLWPFQAVVASTPDAPDDLSESETIEDIDLLRQVRAHLSDEMKAVDTRAGVVIALAAGLAVASLVDVQEGWRLGGIVAALVAAFLGLVALLARTGDSREPALQAVLGRIADRSSSSVIDIETAWVIGIDKALVVRKRYLLVAYTALLTAGVAIVLGMEMQVLYGIYVGEAGTITPVPPIR
jgi:hypothetical protein